MNFRSVVGGLGGMAARYGAHNSVGAVRQREAGRLRLGDNFTLPMGNPREDFDFGAHGVHRKTKNTPIASSNKGFQMLLKMGWRRGSGCGLGGRGIVTPVAVLVPNISSGSGLGKDREYDKVGEAATAGRRLLLVERKESAAEAQERLAGARREETIRAHVRENSKVFFCSDCGKQYRRMSEYEEHLNSYDHHHTVRLRAMRKSRQARAMSGGRQRKRALAASKRQDRDIAARLAAAHAIASANKGVGEAHGTPAQSAPPKGPFKISFGLKKKKKRRRVGDSLNPFV